MYCTYNSNNNNNSNDFYAQCVSFKRITYICTVIDHDEDTGRNNNNNELYLHDHTNTYSIAKTMSGLGIKITTQSNYVTLIIICHEHQNKLKYML